MSADKNLQTLLRWGIENQEAPVTDGSSGANGAQAPAGRTQLTPEAMAALFGGPSEADLMKAAMEAITSTDPDVTLDSKLTAFDNFEQLIESLDNANNMVNLALWEPLLSCLGHDEAEMRRMGAWCVGTAVQNNAKSQEALVSHGGITTLVEMATKDSEDKAVRRKAVYALSSAVRNYQPAMDVCATELQKRGKNYDNFNAEDMDAVDNIMNGLKEAMPN